MDNRKHLNILRSSEKYQDFQSVNLLFKSDSISVQNVNLETKNFMPK